MSQKLDETQLQAAMAGLPKWTLERGELSRTFIFADFKGAIDFVNRVAVLAERANHHPDIDIRYNHVRLSVITHDAGGITRKDIEISQEIDLEFAE